MTCRPLALACTSRNCGRRTAVPGNLVVVAPAGRISDPQPSHSITWTCPTCLWPCCRIVRGDLGAFFLDSGAVAHVPNIESLTVALDAERTITLVATTVNDSRMPCTLVQIGPAEPLPDSVDQLTSRFTFCDHTEAMRWVAQAQHPAGGAA